VKRETTAGLALVAVSALVYWLADRGFDAGRGDFFYLADAFLHGRTWLDFRPGPNDVIVIDGRFYVPFAPFPAILLMPLVAVIGAVNADMYESGINALLAASGVGLCWMLLGRIGVPRLIDRLWLCLLFGFSTQILWVTTRGGVWQKNGAEIDHSSRSKRQTGFFENAIASDDVFAPTCERSTMIPTRFISVMTSRPKSERPPSRS